MKSFFSLAMTICCLCLLSPGFHAQENIRTVLAKATHFETTVKQAEQYFQDKHPGLSAAQLCSGEHRDGDFVKYMRWKAYWKNQLNPDGTLGDPSAYHRAAASPLRGDGALFDEIPWTNLSYGNYITSQIGLGRTTSMGFHPTDAETFYVGAAIGGVWKTTDGGLNYTPIGDNLPALAVSSVIVNQDNPQTLYIALSDHVWYGPSGIGVYKSVNGGATWEPTALSFTYNQNIRIYWMIADPSDADRVFVACDDGLYRTDDGFESVVQVNDLSCFDVKFMPGNPDVVYLGLNNGKLYQSTDGGINFSFFENIGNASCLIAVTPLDPQRVFCRSASVMKRSYDAGLNFDSGVTLPEGYAILQFSPTNADELVIGNFEVYKSTNSGDAFYPVTHWLGNGGLENIHVDQRNAFVNPLQNDYVYLCNDGGVYAFDVNNEEFINLCHGLLITQFYDIAVAQSNENVIGGGSQDNGNVYRNAQGIWDDYAPTGDGMNQEIDPTNANVRYWAYQLGGMQRFESGSNTGIAPPGLDGNGAWETPFKLDYSNPQRIICGYDQVYESLDQGDSWTDIGPAFIGSGNMEQLAIAPSNTNRIYAVRGAKIWAKEVSSNNWVEHTLPYSGISDLEVDPLDMNVVYITVSGYNEGSKVYKSTDAGSNWENISGSLPNVSTGAIETYTLVEGGLFVGTDAGVYYRDNNLTDWEMYGQIPNTRVEDIEIQYSGQKIRIGTHGRGVLEAPVTIGTCEGGIYDEDADGVCDEFDLCPGFEDELLGMPCDDGNANTTDDVYTDCNLCEGIGSVDIQEMNASTFNLYPNAASHFFTVETKEWRGMEIRMHDIQGKLVKRFKLQGEQQQIDISSLAKSTYNVSLMSPEGKILGRKIVVVQ